MSYRGAWDGGPPGAESEYAPRPPEPYAAPAPPARPMPTTDPWTGVSYSQYGPPPYDYQTYNAPTYNYNYDANYYQHPTQNYYDKYQDPRATYPTQDYNYPPMPRSRTKSPIEQKLSERKHRSYSSSSSASDYDKYRKRDLHEEGRKGRSHSRSGKVKRSKYSSSDHSSSHSRSSSHSSRKKKSRRRTSSGSSGSNRSYKKNKAKRNVSREHSYTPPLKKSSSHSRNRSRSGQTPSKERSISRSPRLRRERDVKSRPSKSHSSKDKGRDKKSRDVVTPPRKIKEEAITPPRGQKKSSLTPPRSYIKTERSEMPLAHRGRGANTPTRKGRPSSLTPPKSYARSASSSSSKSRTPSPKPSKSVPRPKRRSRSSSHSSRSSGRSWSSLKRGKDKAKHRSRTKSRSGRRSLSGSRTPSRGRKRSRTPRSRSPSRSKSSHSASRSRTPSEERRGQFTVADRKRFWKLHRSRQEERQRGRPETPPKEVKPPPGAVEPAALDDIEYGDPPEVEGPNFAELLPPAAHVAQASTSRSKPGPLPIKNDGSFLEMFKKMQEETKKLEEPKKPELKKPVLPFIGKRRGGRVLKTGVVKKAKAIEEQLADDAPKDAWSLYMQEVKKYRETSCEEERKTRPLVK